jgi:hypothetical protein
LAAFLRPVIDGAAPMACFEDCGMDIIERLYATLTNCDLILEVVAMNIGADDFQKKLGSQNMKGSSAMKQLSTFKRRAGELAPGPVDGSQFLFDIGDSPLCVACSGLMKPSGTCYTCVNCGQTSGCS